MPKNTSATARSSYMCIQIPAAGGYDKLQYKMVNGSGARGPNIEFQSIPEDQLYQVDVHYTGVNYADICVRWGLYSSAKKFVGWPITPGFEFSGVVSKQASSSRDDGLQPLPVGTPVVGVTMFGGYSQRVVVPRSQLMPLPSKIPPQIAAGLPCAALTAWYALHILATPGRSPGGTEGEGRKRACLIHSAAGGVGSMIARLAKASGRWSPIVGIVGGPHKIPWLEKVGCCDVVVCKRPWETAADVKTKTKSKKSQGGTWWSRVEEVCPQFDAVFDANGAATFQDSYDHLKPEGRLIVYGFHTMLPKEGGRLTPCQWIRMAWSWLRSPTFDPLDMVPSNKSVLAFNLSFLFDRTDLFSEVMGRVLKMVEAGDLGEMPQPALYPLEDVAQAHAAIESGATTGKLVLDAR